MDSKNLDRKKAGAFAERMLATLNSSAIILMTSIGHRTGLFDTMAKLGPASSAKIAAAANLSERYVREWLGAMVTGKIVELDPQTGTYHLPPEHAACLTREAMPGNIAATAQWLAVLGGVEDQIVDCFRKGGGVPYSAYPRFHEVMAEESDQTVLHGLLDSILPIVPGLVDKMEAGVDVIDVGCGSGRAVNLMARRFPKSRFTGCDFSAEGVATGRAEAARLGLTNASFVVVDAAKLDMPERSAVALTFDAVHDQADPRAVLRNIHGSLRRGGVYLMQDIGASSHVHENTDHPLGPFLYTISCMHCMTVSLAADGEGLGAMWGEQQAHQLLAEAGFASVELRRLPHDIQNYYYIATKDCAANHRV